MFDIVNVDDRVDIAEDIDGTSQYYKSKVKAKLANKNLVVYMPVHNGQIVKLSPAKTYILRFVDENKGSATFFKASILKYIRKDGFNFIIFQILSDGEKQQVRRHFRYACRVPFKFFKMSEAIVDEDLGMTMFVRYNGVVKDISGGGLCFFSDEDIEDEVIRCELMLDKYKLLINGKIVGKIRTDKKQPDCTYQYNLQFISIPASDQDRIMKYIFQRQRAENTNQN